MKATVVDLRCRMNDVLKALDRNEEASILYHGKTKGILTPQTARRQGEMTEHPFFNRVRRKRSVADQYGQASRGVPS